MEKSRDCIPFAPFDDIFLDVCHGPTIGCLMSKYTLTYAPSRNNLRCQSLDRRKDGLIELNGLTPTLPPVEGVTNIGAGKSQLDAVRFVGRRVLKILAGDQSVYNIQDETHSYGCEKTAGRNKRIPDWICARRVSRENQGINCRI